MFPDSTSALFMGSGCNCLDDPYASARAFYPPHVLNILLHEQQCRADDYRRDVELRTALIDDAAWQIKEPSKQVVRWRDV